MGVYLNPGSGRFKEIVNKGYVDKTTLISIINRTINTTNNMHCVCMPCGFGKTYAAQMLCAYYDKTCDSHDLFNGYVISEDPDYEKYLGKYDVIYLDMTNILGNVEPENLISFIVDNVTEEILEAYPELTKGNTFDQTLIKCVSCTGNQFIMFIDEWDAPIRETPQIEKEYLKFLRMLFKSSSATSKIFAAAYITGILPIKKDGNQSAVSDFKEYSVLLPGDFAEYVGFTEDEVKRLCEKKQRNFAQMKRWYDGYTVGKIHSVYNPFSVKNAIDSGEFRSYWKKTSAAEALMTYIDMDQEGLQNDIARLLTGESIEISTDSFQNDVENFTCKDDVLTLLVHLGYLTYEEVSDSYDTDDYYAGLVSIPNEEVRSEFEMILRKARHKDLINLVRKSDQLLKDTLDGRSDAVAAAISEVHESEYAPTFYNNEQSLRYVVKMAFISCVDQYAKVEELRTGHGIADVVFLPKRRSVLPAMIVELKWNREAEGALKQIKEKNYPEILKNYGGEIVLVGLTYDEKTKEHNCIIERYKSEEFPLLGI